MNAGGTAANDTGVSMGGPIAPRRSVNGLAELDDPPFDPARVGVVLVVRKPDTGRVREARLRRRS